MLFIKLKKRLELWIFKKRYAQPKDWTVEPKTLLGFVKLLNSSYFTSFDYRTAQQIKFNTSMLNAEELMTLLLLVKEAVDSRETISTLKTLDSFKAVTVDDFLVDGRNYAIEATRFVKDLQRITIELINSISEVGVENGLESYYNRKLQVLFIDVFNLTEALLRVVKD